jgi:hypothetical protein
MHSLLDMCYAKTCDRLNGEIVKARSGKGVSKSDEKRRCFRNSYIVYVVSLVDICSVSCKALLFY